MIPFGWHQAEDWSEQEAERSTVVQVEGTRRGTSLLTSLPPPSSTKPKSLRSREVVATCTLR